MPGLSKPLSDHFLDVWLKASLIKIDDLPSALNYDFLKTIITEFSAFDEECVVFEISVHALTDDLKQAIIRSLKNLYYVYQFSCFVDVRIVNNIYGQETIHIELGQDEVFELKKLSAINLLKDYSFVI